MAVNLTIQQGKDKIGKEGLGLFFWLAMTDTCLFEGVGDTPLDAVMDLSSKMEEHINKYSSLS